MADPDPFFIRQDQKYTSILLKVLSQVTTQRAAFETHAAKAPAPLSDAAADDPDEINRYAVEHARGYWTIGLDFLTTWELVVKGGRLPMLGYSPLLRQALECSVTTRWLMEPRISKADRRQRGAWTQRRDYRDRKGWELATVTSEEGSVPNRAMSAEGRIRALNRRLNMARTPIRVQPTMGELFERYAKDHGDFPWRHKRAKGHPWDLNGHALWSLLSGTAHARMWAVAIATKRKATAPARGSTGSQNVLLTGSDEFMLLFTATAVATSEAALRDLVDYSGHFG